jgi:hypothetical protein
MSGKQLGEVHKLLKIRRWQARQPLGEPILMKLRSTVWPYVCLCSVLSLGMTGNLSAAPAGTGDVPAMVRGVSAKLAETDVEILEHARAAQSDVYSSLRSFVCQEQIDRFKGSLDGESGRPLDTVTARLSFESGVEQYTDVQQDKRPRSGMSSLTGAWSEGEFGTLLLQTQLLLSSQKVDFENFGDVKGQPAAIYHFDVSAEESPWDLAVNGHIYPLPFHTSVWISISTGEILKIDRRTLSLAPATHISEIQWVITLDRFNIEKKVWLLPATGTYAVLYNETQHREWNQISFNGYQRYGARAAIKYN